MSLFAERFKSRILDMADAEVNQSVQVQAATVAIRMSKAGLLEEEDQDRLFPLIFSLNENVQKPIVQHFLEFVEGAIEERLEDLQEKDEDVNSELVRFQVLAELLSRYSILDSSRNSAALQDSQVRDSQSSSMSASGVENSVNDIERPRSFKHHRAMIVRGATSSAFGFCDYFEAPGNSSESLIGYDRVHAVVRMISESSPTFLSV